MQGVVHLLFIVTQLLEQLFAGAQARDNHLDILIGNVAAQSYKRARQVVNVHRLAHVQNEHLAARRKRARLQHEPDRLGNRHEITFDISVRHSHWPAFVYLAQERRNYRARRTEHVAEPHRSHLHIAVGRARLHKHFRKPLGRAHYVGGIDRLVGGNKHKPLYARLLALLDYVFRAEHVVFYRLGRRNFHHRHMLVRRGMEHRFGLILFKHGGELVRLAHSAHYERIPRGVVLFVELLVDGEHAVFVLVENDEVLAPEIKRLTAQLRADRPRAARYHNDLVLDGNVDQLLAHLELVSAQERFDFYIAQLQACAVYALRVADRRQNLNRLVEPRKLFVYGAQPLLGQIGYGDYEIIGLVPLHNLVYFRKPARNGHAAYHAAVLFIVVVDKRDGQIPLVGIIDKSVYKHRADIARAVYNGAQRFFGFWRVALPEVLVVSERNIPEPQNRRGKQQVQQEQYNLRRPQIDVERRRHNGFYYQQEYERHEIRANEFQKLHASRIFPHHVVAIEQH